MNTYHSTAFQDLATIPSGKSLPTFGFATKPNALPVGTAWPAGRSHHGEVCWTLEPKKGPQIAGLFVLRHGRFIPIEDAGEAGGA